MNMKNNMDSLEKIVLVMDKTIDFGIAIAGLGLITYSFYGHNPLSFALGDVVAHMGLVMYLGDSATLKSDKDTDFRGREGNLRNRRYNDAIFEYNYDR